MKIPFLKRIQNKKALADIELKLREIRKTSDLLAICPKPNGYSWLGVNVATKSLFQESVIELPQHYSESFFDSAELRIIVGLINDLNYKQVIFSSFPPFYFEIVTLLNKSVKKKVIYHGFLAELAGNQRYQMIFKQLIEYTQSGIINSIGFVKKGFALSIAKLYNISCFEIILPNHHINSEIKPINKGIEIGCMVNNSFRKNIHNQVLGATLINNSKVHVFNNSDLKYLDEGQLIYHNSMKHVDFIDFIGNMTLNLHITFSEGMGGQICAESISQGVPCISANTSSFFDYDEELKNKLVVGGFDDSWFIYLKIEEVLKDRDYLAKKCIDYAHTLNKLAYQRLDLFLNN